MQKKNHFLSFLAGAFAVFSRSSRRRAAQTHRHPAQRIRGRNPWQNDPITQKSTILHRPSTPPPRSGSRRPPTPHDGHFAVCWRFPPGLQHRPAPAAQQVGRNARRRSAMSPPRPQPTTLGRGSGPSARSRGGRSLRLHRACTAQRTAVAPRPRGCSVPHFRAPPRCRSAAAGPAHHPRDAAPRHQNGLQLVF